MKLLKISDTAKRMLVIMLALCLIIYVVGIFFANDILAYTFGVLLGTAVSVLRLILIEKSLEKSVDMVKENATNYAKLSYFARYFLTAVVLVIAAVVDGIDLIGAILPVFTMQIAAFLVPLIFKINVKQLKDELKLK